MIRSAPRAKGIQPLLGPQELADWLGVRRELMSSPKRRPHTFTPSRPCPKLGSIFANERGGPIQKHPFSQVFASGARRAGLPEWTTPHDLRH